MNKPNWLSSQKHLIFVLVTLCYWIGMYTYVPILSPYLESLGATYSYVGIVLGSYGFMQILFRLPIGIASDRMRVRRPYMIAGMAAVFVSCLLFALTSTPGWALVARAISGIAASTWVAFTVLYASYYAKDQATQAMGTISFMTVIGQCIGMVLSGMLVDHYSWHATFWVGACAGIVGLIACLFIKEPQEGVFRDPIQTKDITAVMREKLLLKVSTLSILAHIILFVTMFGFTPSYAVDLGATTTQVSLLSFVFMVPHAIASLSAGRWLAPRFGAWNVVIIGFVVSSLCTLLIPFTSSLGLLMVTQAFNGFAQGLHMPLLMGLAIQSINQEKRATAMGFYQAVYALGMFGGPFIAGWLNDWYDLQGGFFFAGIVGLVAILLTSSWKQRANLSLR